MMISNLFTKEIKRAFYALLYSLIFIFISSIIFSFIRTDDYRILQEWELTPEIIKRTDKLSYIYTFFIFTLPPLAILFFYDSISYFCGYRINNAPLLALLIFLVDVVGLGLVYIAFQNIMQGDLLLHFSGEIGQKTYNLFLPFLGIWLCFLFSVIIRLVNSYFRYKRALKTKNSSIYRGHAIEVLKD